MSPIKMMNFVLTQPNDEEAFEVFAVYRYAILHHLNKLSSASNLKE